MSTTTVHAARKARPCGSYPCSRSIEPGQRYLRHVAFPGDEGHEEGTWPWVIEECDHCVTERIGRNGVTADEWNIVHPVGTPVVAYPGTREGRAVHGCTRSLAWNLGSGSPVVLVDGLTGGIALTHVDVTGAVAHA